ncbi:MAG: long-chain fatty acid--CoA ligase [Rhodospirillales bacterium]|nr:long-chain fatty acid--CoA ligase [Rhodospirillales bacterium]
MAILSGFMKMPCNNRETFLEKIRARTTPDKARFISDSDYSFSLSMLNVVNRLYKGPTEYSGRNVMIRTHGQFATALAALALDGVARRILLCPADIPDAQIPRLMQDGEAELILTDADIDMKIGIAIEGDIVALPRFDTEWVLFTSGTSGLPKLVLHSFASLTGHLGDGLSPDQPVWGTFYDIRRYGGLQILLRALTGAGSMVLSRADEQIHDFITRLGSMGVTHISGTPSHWRRVLMSGVAEKMNPSYIRLSGEIAGQDILDCLHSAYPQAKIGHAYASTEAGVAFSVDDGQAGFPQSVPNAVAPRPNIRIVDGTLRVRSSAMASRYLGATAPTLVDADGYVDTGDIVEQRGDRYIFIGRREGVVNVGGLKVHPEEVEATINLHPAVAMSRVWGQPSPITGALIAADVVLTPKIDGIERDFSDIRQQIIAACRTALAPHKVPVRLIEVSEIPVMTSGKIERHHA